MYPLEVSAFFVVYSPRLDFPNCQRGKIRSTIAHAMRVQVPRHSYSASARQRHPAGMQTRGEMVHFPLSGA
jgi:hypothetical protein